MCFEPGYHKSSSELVCHRKENCRSVLFLKEVLWFAFGVIVAFGVIAAAAFGVIAAAVAVAAAAAAAAVAAATVLGCLECLYHVFTGVGSQHWHAALEYLAGSCTQGTKNWSLGQRELQILWCTANDEPLCYII
jgi:hypothetical protein